MSIHKISDYANLAPKGFVPSQDGPATIITFPDNAPGFRRISAAEGDLTNTVQPDTIKYLLEITAANGTTATVARTLKMYTYNVETGDFTYLYTLSGLPNAIAPIYDYGEAFWVNVAGGYFCFESNRNLWVFSLADGGLCGSSGNIIVNAGLVSSAPCYAIVPHPTNPNVFNFIYGNTTPTTSLRQVTVDPNNKTVDWGTQTTYARNTHSYSGQAMPDTRSTANPGDWIIGRSSIASTTYYSNPLVLNPTTGVMTAAPNANAGGSTYHPGARFLDGDEVIFGGFGSANMTFFKGNPWANATTTTLPSWGASGVVHTIGLQEYFDLDGTTGKYYALADANTDAWVSRVTPNVGTFGSALFRASSVISGFTISGTSGRTKPIIVCKNGFFYVGHMSTTGTTAPVIWYPLKPNLP